MNDPYWTVDTSLFDGQFRYFGSERVQVRGKVHIEQETYRKSDVNLEITPIRITQGMRTYLHLRPFVLVPDIRVTIGLYPEPQLGGAIGEVIGAQERRMKEVEIGNAQVWSYPDGTLVLWECYLDNFVCDHSIDQDPNMKALWESFTRFLCQQFAESVQVVTTSHDPLFETEEYHEFLRSLGYRPIAKAAWGKSINRD